MSTWKRKAMECLPERKHEIEQETIYGVFMIMFQEVKDACKEQNDNYKVKRIYDFAEWCFSQKATDLWNAAGVTFYEHLADYTEVREQIPRYLKYEIFVEIRGLLEWRVGEAETMKIEKAYSGQYVSLK